MTIPSTDVRLARVRAGMQALAEPPSDLSRARMLARVKATLAAPPAPARRRAVPRVAIAVMVALVATAAAFAMHASPPPAPPVRVEALPAVPMHAPDAAMPMPVPVPMPMPAPTPLPSPPPLRPSHPRPVAHAPVATAAALYAAAEQAFRGGDDAGGEHALEELLRLHPDDARAASARYDLALSAIRRGDRAAARRWLDAGDALDEPARYLRCRLDADDHLATAAPCFVRFRREFPASSHDAEVARWLAAAAP